MAATTRPTTRHARIPSSVTSRNILTRDPPMAWETVQRVHDGRLQRLGDRPHRIDSTRTCNFGVTVLNPQAAGHPESSSSATLTCDLRRAIRGPVSGCVAPCGCKPVSSGRPGSVVKAPLRVPLNRSQLATRAVSPITITAAGAADATSGLKDYNVRRSTNANTASPSAPADQPTPPPASPTTTTASPPAEATPGQRPSPTKAASHSPPKEPTPSSSTPSTTPATRKKVERERRSTSDAGRRQAEPPSAHTVFPERRSPSTCSAARAGLVVLGVAGNQRVPALTRRGKLQSRARASQSSARTNHPHGGHRRSVRRRGHISRGSGQGSVEIPGVHTRSSIANTRIGSRRAHPAQHRDHDHFR